MEGYKASEHGTEEMYMVQGSDSYPQLATAPSFDQFEVRDAEGAPEYIVDQGLYYPATTNYYPYYFTGYESTGEWDDSHRFLGLDSPNLHYAGLQAESLPFVYYTPSYGYAQSPYNPYNPYIPGAVIGADGSFVGMQQYYTGSTYAQPASPAYYPLLVQPMTENTPSNGHELHSLNAGASNTNGSDVPGNLQSTSGGLLNAPLKLSMADGDNKLNQSHLSNKRSEISKTVVPSNKQPAIQMNIASASVSGTASSQIAQDTNSSGAVRGTDQLAFGHGPSLRPPVNVCMPVTNASTDFNKNARGFSMVDKFRPRLHYGGVSNNGNSDSDFLGEQNRGPRTNRSRGQWTPSASIGLHATDVGSSVNEKIIVCPDQYNKENFPLNYVNGKFFVIKSYSEDDVHKSIKYNVWSSTPNGNKRLATAYEDAQKIAAGNSRVCPVFLFFSVNASGQFCGVAEMIGPVDFNRDMNFWQQDKWSGSLPVKWHIIKDVPNTNFRHIILENNENKPVTNSRDTQEIKYRQGLEMLSIFKNHTLKTSILDDFMYYEERQRVLQEEKARLHGKSYSNSFYIPAIVPPEKNISIAKQPSQGQAVNMPSLPSNSGRKIASTIDQVPLKPDILNSSSGELGNTKHNSLEVSKGVMGVLKIGSISMDPKHVESLPVSAAVKRASTEPVDTLSVGSKSFPNSSSSEESNTKHNLVELNNSVTDSLKIDSLSIDPKTVETKPAATAMAETTGTDVFTVGSMPVKVNGFSEASSVILTVGSIPIVPRVVLDKANTRASSKGGI